MVKNTDKAKNNVSSTLAYDHILKTMNTSEGHPAIDKCSLETLRVNGHFAG
jgi:hypothetical protein